MLGLEAWKYRFAGFITPSWHYKLLIFHKVFGDIGGGVNFLHTELGSLHTAYVSLTDRL